MFRAFILLLSTTALCSSGTVMAANVDGAEIYWESFGDGPAIVLIHGLDRDTTDWRYQVEEFKGDYRVIALDLPGHGQSGELSDPEDQWRLYAEAVEAVRAEAGLDRLVLVGHSLGGFVTGEYTRRHPEHVAAVVAVDAILGDRIEVPALYVLAVNGPVLRREQPAALLQRTPRGRVEVMPEGVGHDVQIEDPAGFNRLLRQFLEEIDF